MVVSGLKLVGSVKLLVERRKKQVDPYRKSIFHLGRLSSPGRVSKSLSKVELVKVS